MSIKCFKLKTLNLDLGKGVLSVNGKEVSTKGITDFSLTLEPEGFWTLTAKRDITLDFYEDVSLPAPANHMNKEGVREMKTQSGMDCICEVSQIMNFNESQKEKGEKILNLLKGMPVEEGIELLEKCIFQHSYYGWERQYMTEPVPYGIGISNEPSESQI